MTEAQAIENIVSILDNIEKTDNAIIKIAENLKIVLLNLKIEDARLKENTSISVIVDALNKSITTIENNVKKLSSSNQGDLIAESIKVLKDNLERSNT